MPPPRALAPGLLLLLLLLPACSSPVVGSDAPTLDAPSTVDAPGAADAPSPDDAPLDAPAPADAPALPCPARPWGEPVSLAALNGASDSADARLTDDELYAIANHDLGPVEFRRATIGETFAATRALTELDPPGTATQMYAPTLSRDGLTLYVSADPGAGGLDIFVATRADVDAAFGALMPAVASAGGDLELGGFPAPDGLYYWGGPSSTAFDLYVVPLAGGAPTPLTVLNATGALDESPVVSADGLTLYFSSDRPDPSWEGFTDIYVARRDALGEAFSAPRRVAELSGPTFDRPTWISADECRMYLDRHAASGPYSIYYAERLP